MTMIGMKSQMKPPILSIRNLARFSITPLRHRRPDEISGGEARRASIARSMAPKPALLLLDEPMTHLDEDLKDDALDFLMEEAGESGTTLLFVTHDASEAQRVSPRCLRFAEGKWEVTQILHKSAADGNASFAAEDRPRTGKGWNE